MARRPIIEILRQAEQLNSPQVAKAQGVGKLLMVVLSALRVLATDQERLRKLEEQYREQGERIAKLEALLPSAEQTEDADG